MFTVCLLVPTTRSEWSQWCVVRITLLICACALSTVATNKHEYLLWHNADFYGLNDFINSVNWYDVLCLNLSPQALWLTFIDRT